MNAVSPITSSDIENGPRDRLTLAGCVPEWKRKGMEEERVRRSSPEYQAMLAKWPDAIGSGPTDEEEHSLSFAQMGLSK